jgi:hypothetical protein
MRPLTSTTSALAAIAAGMMALSAGGCSDIAGDQDAETKFLLKPGGDGNFFGWSEITIDQDANSVDGATLRFVTLERMEGVQPGDLTFIHSVIGEAVNPESRTLLVTKTKMPAGEMTVPLDVVYDDDLRQFFPDGHTIRVEWNGSADTTGLPAEGVWIRVKVRVHIE